MPPASRPTVTLPEGSVYVPASLPSARRAVSVTALPVAAGGSAIGAAGRADAPPRRKPHEPQNRFVGPLTWPHCGQSTVALPAAAAGGGAAPGDAGAAAGGGADAAGPRA